jgi:L-amino acid N-acyltransferase
MTFTIRDAQESDLPGLLEIYNEVIANSTAVFSHTAATLEDRREWWLGRVAMGYPVLIAMQASQVLGFATFADFRSWSGYRFTVEHTVHVRHDVRGRGIGRELLIQLLPRAATLGKHVMVAGVDAANAASIRFHERLGFEQVGRLREVGFKFGRWLDLIFLQRWIGASAPPAG